MTHKAPRYTPLGDRILYAEDIAQQRAETGRDPRLETLRIIAEHFGPATQSARTLNVTWTLLNARPSYLAGQKPSPVLLANIEALQETLDAHGIKTPRDVVQIDPRKAPAALLQDLAADASALQDYPVLSDDSLQRYEAEALVEDLEAHRGETIYHITEALLDPYRKQTRKDLHRIAQRYMPEDPGPVPQHPYDKEAYMQDAAEAIYDTLHPQEVYALAPAEAIEPQYDMTIDHGFYIDTQKVAQTIADHVLEELQ